MAGVLLSMRSIAAMAAVVAMVGGAAASPPSPAARTAATTTTTRPAVIPTSTANPTPGQPWREQPASCVPEHDAIALSLSLFLCVGLVVSYLPQIIRIVHKRSSLGFSPWFLLLGATSSSSSFLNLVALQWGLVRCCRVISAGACAESMMGIVQVMLQWLLFNIILVLFLVYYPKELRYERPHHGFAHPPNDSALGSTTSHLTGTTEGGAGDLDALDSHIAANYSGITSPGDSGLGAASGSAFERLVPSFWPMWKAPKRQALSAHEEEEDDDEDEDEEDEEEEELLSDVEEVGESQVGASGLNPSARAGLNGHTDNGEHAALLGIPAEMRAWRHKRGAKRRTPEWNLALALAWVVALHFVFILAITLLLVSAVPDAAYPDPVPYPPIPPPAVAFSPVQLALADWNAQTRLSALNVTSASASSPSSLLFSTNTSSLLFNPTLAHGAPTTTGTSAAFQALLNSTAARDSRKVISRWAAFLGITGTLLAAGQYLPQIVHTQRIKAVGSLSIPMMCLQVPGSVIFVYSLAIRPGAEWSTVAAYIATGVLQLVLLIQCVVFTVRQKRLGLDDYGRPLVVAEREGEGERLPRNAVMA